MSRLLLAIVVLLIVYNHQYILDIIALPKNMPILAHFRLLGVIVIVIIMLNRRNEKRKFDVFDARLVSDSMENPERRPHTKVRRATDGGLWQMTWHKLN